MLDKQYHPIPPDDTCPQSVQIFEEHKQVSNLFFHLILINLITLLDYLHNFCFFLESFKIIIQCVNRLLFITTLFFKNIKNC